MIRPRKVLFAFSRRLCFCVCLMTFTAVVSGGAFAQDVSGNARPKATSHSNSNSNSNSNSKFKAKSKKTKTVRARSREPALPSPAKFVEARVQKVLTDLKSRPLRTAESPRPTFNLETSAEKQPWLASLYDKNMIEASWATEMLSDKLVMARVLERELGARAVIYYPKTIGLRDFLVRHRLVKTDGTIVPDGDRIETALHQEFPAGFVVRPAVGVAPRETGKGMFPDTDQFIVELLKPDNPVYGPDHLRQPVKSHLLEAIASGEAVVLQENIIGTADAQKPLKTRFYQEVRIHTYEGRTIEGAVPERWVQTSLLNEEQVKRAEEFVADFLKSLPLALLNRQAWGVDVAVMDNGQLRIVDVVTNRGRRIPWSGYLEQPRVIGAYARHFERYYGLRFAGFSGALIRNNLGNYLPYWSKRIEKARPGLGKMMAYLPPIP